MPRAFSFTVSGVVQGVNFRAYTKRIGSSLSVTGYVQNDPLGTVSGVAQGEAEALEKFKEAIRTGPFHAQVEGVKIENEEEIVKLDYTMFDIRR